MRMKQGTTDQYIYFVAVDATDLKTREVGITLGNFACYYSINGGTATAMTTPTVAETDSTNMQGVYELLIDEGGMTTLAAGDDTSELVLHITDSGAVMAPVTRVIEIYREETTAGNTLDVTAAGEAGLDLDNTSGALGTTNFDADFLTAALIADNALVAANFAAGAFDAVWSVAARILTANTNFNDPTAAVIADAVWDEDIEAAHGGDAAAGLLLRALGAAISNRSNNATLDALLGVSDVAAQDLAEQLLRTEVMAELGVGIPAAAPTLEALMMLLYMALRDKATATASLLQIFNDAGTAIAQAALTDDATTATRAEMVAGV